MDVELAASLFLIGFLASVTIATCAVSAAYRNGVVDGYGYAKSPDNATYGKAGRYLRENCAHWWPELRERKINGEKWQWGTNREV